jgi:LPXTG-motif cell wall-anchored protein
LSGQKIASNSYLPDAGDKKSNLVPIGIGTLVLTLALYLIKQRTTKVKLNSLTSKK